MKAKGADNSDASGSGGILALLADDAVGLALIPMPRIGAPPPTELRAFRWGNNPTTKGVFKLTPEGAQKILARQVERGVVRCFDYFHATYDPTARPQDKKAAGQYRMEVRPKTSNDPLLDAGGLWFVDIQWDPLAAAEISRGCWPYISPAPVHDKDGVIIDCRNSALVTDPATHHAMPTILDATSPPAERDYYREWCDRFAALLNASKGPQMADKKRLYLDTFSAAQTTMKRAQSLADTDGMDKELGNKVVAGMAPLMDMLASYGSTNGYMGDAMLAAAQSDAGFALLSDLATECGESDLTKLGGAVMARLDGKVPAAQAPDPKGVLLSDTEAATLTKHLLDANAAKVPAARRAQLEAKGLHAVTTYLAASTNITPEGAAPREAAPIAPTTTNVEKTVKDATPAPAAGDKPTTLVACNPQQRALVEGFLDISRRTQGDKFDEAVEMQHAFACLADAQPVAGNEIRHLPYGADQPTTLMTGEA